MNSFFPQSTNKRRHYSDGHCIGTSSTAFFFTEVMNLGKIDAECPFFFSEPRRGDRKSECSFCSERFSSEEMKDHLLRCGNKTEQCPNCHKFIRRAIFAYHYENQCQDLPDDKTTTERKEDSSAFVICPFCSQRCPKKDQQTHQVNISRVMDRHSFIRSLKENCLSKPRQRPNEIVRIPCEYCEEQVDLNQWAIHTVSHFLADPFVHLRLLGGMSRQRRASTGETREVSYHVHFRGTFDRLS